MTQHLFSSAGRAGLAALAAGRSLLAFDLDGTLAPLVAHPADARVGSDTAARLRALATRWPVAVLTGRETADASHRLGFRPHYLFGNHGAQRPGESTRGGLHDRLDECRTRLAAEFDSLCARGIEVEDKGLSLALHYRGAADMQAARTWLEAFAAALEPTLAATHGNCVLNLAPIGAPDKGDALLDILRDSGATASLVIGDDTNDEPAFARAPPSSVSVRIAPAGTPTCARFSLPDQGRVDALLDLLLTLRR